jgi:hypothetical protein
VAQGLTKAAVKRLAVEVRQELGLTLDAVLDPYALAELYGVPVFTLEEVGCSPPALKHFTVARPQIFSAALVPCRTGAVIVENAAHAPVRRRSTLTHEMAHVLLEHRFTAMLVNDRGCRSWDGNQEAQANELAGELLVPFETAKRLAYRGVTNEEVALAYQVSVEFAAWRMNATGARKIARRRAAAYGRTSGA